MSGRPHHPECGRLSVPDVFIRCHECDQPTKWCGCMWRCPVHGQPEAVSGGGGQ